MPDDRHCEERPDAAPGEVPRVAVEHLLRLHLDCPVAVGFQRFGPQIEAASGRSSRAGRPTSVPPVVDPSLGHVDNRAIALLSFRRASPPDP